LKKKQKKTLGDLETSNKKTKIQKVQQKKSTNPPNQFIASILKVIIWGFIIFVSVVGVYNLVVPRPPQIIEERVVLDISPVEGETAQAFARTFAKEYFTFTKDKTEYQARLEPFLLNTSLVNFDYRDVESEVLDAIVWSVEKLDEAHANIVVRVEYKTTDNIDKVEEFNINGEATMISDIQQTITFLNVPIVYHEGRFGVDDYVNIVENQNLKVVDYTPEIFTGTGASKEVTDQVKVMLENFFEVYTSGNTVNISYYVDNKSDLKLQGIDNFTFDSIQNLKVFTDEKESFKVMVTVKYEEKNIGTLFPSVYLIDVQQSDSQFYITDMVIRRKEF